MSQIAPKAGEPGALTLRQLILAPEGRARVVFTTLVALAATIAVVALVVGLLGANPASAFKALIEGALGSKFSFGQTVMITSLLALTGLAAAIPFSAHLWNIGGEGQLYIGAFMAAASALTLPSSLPHWLFAPVVVVIATISGAIWGFIPGFLKATVNANEVITSLMLGFIAILFANYAVTELWPQGVSPQTRDVPANALMPNIWSGTLITVGAPLAVFAIFVAYLIMERTPLGFEIRAIGFNDRAARLSGMRVGRTVVVTFALGGAFAGLAGSISVLGMNGALVTNFSANFGFIGIAVALLARLRPAWILPSAFFFAILRVGSNGLQAATGLSPTIGELLVTTFVILLLAFKVIRLRYAEAGQ